VIYASEDLINEHEGILFGLNILEKMVLMINAKNTVETEDIIEIIDFLKLFADKCHHGKEEGLLFPAMEKAGIQKESSPIGQMLFEHNEGRKYLSQIKGSINNGVLDENIFIQSASDYIKLLRNHINKENNILFPLGDKMIPEEAEKELLKSFEKFEEEVMGKGTHEKLHKILHKFEKKFL
jgi:hemerythrin-like domain-containing protein